jgi:RNA polymerase sigma-70 factor (ECF subfamily)
MMERDSKDESLLIRKGLETHFMDRQDEIGLVAKAKAGDTDAFARLFDTHFTMVYGVASSTVRDRTAAQDITQEVFLAAWKKMGDLRNEGAFPMWLRRMTRNLSVSWLRNLTYRRALAERSGRDSHGAKFEEPASQDSIRKERLEHIWEGLNTLRPKLRDAVVLYYMEGQSIVEAANALGITSEAMKSRLHKGRTQLKRHFESSWEEELRSEMLGTSASSVRERLASTMALGPVIPISSSALSPSAFSLWFHQWIHGGTSSVVTSALKGGAFFMSTKKIGIAIVVLLLALGGLIGTGNLPGWRSDSLREQSAQSQADARDAMKEPGEPVANQLADVIDSENAEKNLLESIETAVVVEKDETDSVVRRKAADNSSNSEKEHGEIEDPEDYVAISGQVVDEKGNGVSGATVTAQASGYTFDEVGDDYFTLLNAARNPGHQFIAVADANGHYSLDGIRYEGTMAVRAKADGFAQQYRSQVHIDIEPGDSLEGVNVLLSPGVTAPFQIVSSSGLPVPDGIVSLLGYRVGTTSSGGLTDVLYTDAEGRFSISIDGPGIAAFNVASATFGSTSFSSVPIERNADVTRLEMLDMAGFDTSIEWGDGSPAAGVEVRLKGLYEFPDGDHDYRGTEENGISDENGVLQFAVDPGLRYQVELFSADRKALSPSIDIGRLEPGETRTWDYVIEQPIIVRGTVYGEVTGEPLRDVEVDVIAKGASAGVGNGDWNEEDSLQIPVVKVDSGGRYELRILAGPGEYHVYPRHLMRNLYADGHDIGETVRLTAGEELELDLTLPDTFTMSILVLDINGEAIEDATVCINESGGEIIHGENVTDELGRWSWSGFQAGAGSSVSIYSGGRERVRTDRIYGQPGEVVPEQIMLLHEYGGLEGVATDVDGNPLPNTEINVAVAYADNQSLNVRLMTDDSGEFVTLDRIPATDIYLEMRINGHETLWTWQSEPLAVPAEQVVMLGSIVFTPEPPEDSENNIRIARQ